MPPKVEIAIGYVWIQERFAAEPSRNDSGANFLSEMIRVSAQKSELQAKSRSCTPKVRVTAEQTPRIRTESPRPRPEWRLGASAENAP